MELIKKYLKKYNGIFVVIAVILTINKIIMSVIPYYTRRKVLL